MTAKKRLAVKGTLERVAAVGVIGNIMLVVLKLASGLIGRSSAMVSDAIHSLSDVLATLVAYLGATFSNAPEDKAHPYGHEQFETIATVLVGLALLGTGVAVCYQGFVNVCRELYIMSTPEMAPMERAVPTVLPLLAAIVSIVAKEAMFWYTLFYANKLNSSAFRADAWHHRTDAFSSIGSLVGIVGARMGLPLMDPLASIVISCFILWIAFKILRGSASQMVDTACDDEFIAQMVRLILETPGVDRLDLVRTRKFGARVFVEAEIAVDGNLSLFDAHRVASAVHDAIERDFSAVKHVMVHVNPTQLEDSDAVLSQTRSENDDDAEYAVADDDDDYSSYDDVYSDDYYED